MPRFTDQQNAALEFYKTRGPLTDIGRYTDQISGLPNDVAALARVTQNLIVHDMWLARYGVELSAEHVCQQSTPSMENVLRLALEIKRGPLASNDRTPSEKVIACCREFSSLLCAFLRAKGIPARARCGFAAYLAKDGYYEDHWICEFWNGEGWQRVDPQIDTLQLNSIQSWAKAAEDARDGYRKMLLDLDPMNVGEAQFMLAAKAWQLCRANQTDPARYGISCDPTMFGLQTLYGMWFIRGNLLRDFASLNKVELVPLVSGLEREKGYWDSWRLMSAKDVELGEEDWKLLDRIAVLTLDPDKNLEEILDMYESNAELRPTKRILGSQSLS